MPLSSGTRLGPYEILAPLGAGGMGEVYRAADSKLGREVALKFLPDGLAGDPDRFARFTREAQVLAALNHPAHRVHLRTRGIGRRTCPGDGTRGGPDPGRPHRRRSHALGRGGPVARQIAEALEAAHEKGIIHRDLKPANVKITPEGEVKVLDFGLAKVTERAGKSSDLTQSPTLTIEATQAGVIMGTAAYMPPEQARGRCVDRRADIWSFGVVLYEMLTGRRAFSGTTVTDILAAVLKLEPDWSALPADTPEPLVRLLHRCLDKDRKHRLRDIGEARIVLEGPLAPPARHPTPSAAGTAGQGRRIPVAAAAALIAGAALGAGGFWLANGGRPAASALPELVYRQLTRDAGLTTQPAISPDGKFVVYASDRAGNGDLDLWLQQVQGGGLPVRLTQDAADEHEPTFSPDGSTIAFRSERDGGGLYSMAAVGGEPRLIARGGHDGRFSPDGTQLAYWSGGRLASAARSSIFVAPVQGGATREITSGQVFNRYPLWTPDGKQILFSAGGNTGREWWVATLGPPDTVGRLAVNAPSFAAAWWNGMVLMAPRKIVAAHLKAGSWAMEGRPIPVTTGSGSEDFLSTSTKGDLAFASLTHNTNIYSLPVDSAAGKVTGPLRRITRNAEQQRFPSLSLDGRFITYLSPGAGIIVRELATGKESVALQFPLAYPSLSPDRQRIAVTGRPPNKDGFTGIFLVDAEGGKPELVCDDCGLAPTWSSDGKKILYDWGTPRFVGLLDLEKKIHGPVIRMEKRGVYQGTFSPDDRWILFEVEYGGDHAGISVAPYRDGATVDPAQWIAITDGKSFDSRPRFSPDGRRVYFISDRDGFRCIWSIAVDPATKRAAGQASPVTHFHTSRQSIHNVGAVSAFVLSVGGDQLIFNLGEVTGNIWLASPAEPARRAVAQ